MNRADGKAKYTIMTVLDGVHDYNIDLEKREIYLFSNERYIDSCDTEEEHAEPGVDWVMANQFLRNIRILQSASATDPILVHMNTPGGDWMQGMAIYQSIKACPNHVTILNYAAARSMSSIILQAADHRAMMPYSWFMMHEGDTGYEGTQKQVRSEIEFDRRAGWDNIMVGIYVEKMALAHSHAGKTKRQLKSLVKGKMNNHEEWYLTAEETVEHGLADVIFGEDGTFDWTTLRFE